MNTLSLSVERLLNGVQTLAIVCSQWGDTGKGKFVDFFAHWADIIARGTGGANAGHTICLNGKEYVFHLIPSGILYDCEGKTNVIGRGVAFDPRVIVSELCILKREGLPFNRLTFSKDAKLMLPQHILMDRLKESKKGGTIGTTGRGIGPCYRDHYDRVGLTVNDMLNVDVFAQKLICNMEEKFRLLKTEDPEAIKHILQHEHLEYGIYCHPEKFLDVDTIIAQYQQYAEEFKHMIRDTDAFMRENPGKQRILLEGAQGILLSVDFGTYPYVTASDSAVQNLAKGVGLWERSIDLTLSIVKAFYMTRVGGGPFPTEIGREGYKQFCTAPNANKKTEWVRFGTATVNDADGFMQSVGIRTKGGEYGATTGRPRRIGWLDLPLLKHSLLYTRPDVILTKLDVLDECQVIQICTSYAYTGPGYQLGKRALHTGDTLDIAVMDGAILEHCTPRYESFPGWQRPIHDIQVYEDLPTELRFILEFVKKETGINPRLLSVGPDRKQTIVVG